MSISGNGSQVDQLIWKLYLATCEGNFCYPVESVSNLEILVKEGYIEVTKCRSDLRSKHGANTCKVELVWLTDKGKKAAKEVTRTFDEALRKLEFLLENTNPRVSILGKYLLARWSASILAIHDVLVGGDRRGGWNMLPAFEWDIRVPRMQSVLPESVKDELKAIPGRLVELELAEWNRLGHNVSGWYDSETLMSIKPVAQAILRNFGGFEIPWFIESLILSIPRARREAELSYDLEHSGGKILIESMVDYLNYGSFHDLKEFLRTIESLDYWPSGEGYAQVNWNLVEKYVKPRVNYAIANHDEMRREVVSRRHYGLMPSVHAVTSLRHSLILEAVEKSLAAWFDTGTLCVEEIPSLKILWDLAKEETEKKIQAIFRSGRRIESGIPPLEDGKP